MPAPKKLPGQRKLDDYLGGAAKDLVFYLYRFCVKTNTHYFIGLSRREWGRYIREIYFDKISGLGSLTAYPTPFWTSGEGSTYLSACRIHGRECGGSSRIVHKGYVRVAQNAIRKAQDQRTFLGALAPKVKFAE